jgi:F0F1-type ATP synthase membrane subunit c/vacuolar-type H+-ATPase subunit K
MPEMELVGALGAGVGLGLAAAGACGGAAAPAAPSADASPSVGLKFSHMGIFAVSPETLGTLCVDHALRPPSTQRARTHTSPTIVWATRTHGMACGVRARVRGNKG